MLIYVGLDTFEIISYRYFITGVIGSLNSSTHSFDIHHFRMESSGSYCGECMKKKRKYCEEKKSALQIFYIYLMYSFSKYGLLCAGHCSRCYKHIRGNLLFLVEIEIVEICLTCVSFRMNKDMTGLQIIGQTLSRLC